MVANLLYYPWSSHFAYLGRSKICWLTTQSVFDLLTHNKNREIAAYKKFMQKLLQLQRVDDRIIKATLREIIELLCEYYGIKETDLHMRSQNRMFSKIRLMSARLVIQFKIANLSDIAAYFNRDVSTFSRGLHRMPISDNVEFDNIKHYVESTIVQA